MWQAYRKSRVLNVLFLAFFSHVKQSFSFNLELAGQTLTKTENL